VDTENEPGQLRPLPLSQRLRQIVAEDGPDRLTFSDLALKLHARAWGGLLVIFAAINVIPLPPGASIFFAIPLLIVSAQMAFGRASPWFPARIDRRGVTKDELGRLITKMEWLEVRVERLFKPRLATLTGPAATRLIGVVAHCPEIILGRDSDDATLRKTGDLLPQVERLVVGMIDGCRQPVGA
jgi:hypothetical protein